MPKDFQKIPMRRFQGRFIFSGALLVFLPKEKKMKRLFFMVAILLSLVMANTTAEAQSISKVLLIPREGESANLDFMLKREVGVMTDLLQKAGFKVVVANVSGQPLEGIINKLKPDFEVIRGEGGRVCRVYIAMHVCRFVPWPAGISTRCFNRQTSCSERKTGGGSAWWR